MTFIRRFIAAAACLASLNACSTGPKLATPLNSGYDKITIARADGPETDVEPIKPEFISEIRKTADVYTVIEVYQAKNGQVNALADQVVAGFRRMSGRVPGLVSFNVLKGADRRVLNYAQFENKAAFEAWKAGAAFKQSREAVKPFAMNVEDERFDVVYIQQ